MSTFRGHVPAFMLDPEERRNRQRAHRAAEARSTPFTSTEDLLAIPWIAQWTGFEGFLRFTILRDFDSEDLLMAEFTRREWYVVGYLSHPNTVVLPEWKGWTLSEIANRDQA